LNSYKIALNTMKEIYAFVAAVSLVNGEVYLTDGDKFRINAKSVLGAMYTAEWKELYVESTVPIYTIIQSYIVN